MAEKINGGAAREAMVFPFRWFDTLGALDDRELRRIFDAIGAYAARGAEPEFSGVEAALWNEIRQRIDSDKKQYEAICERNRRNIRKRWDAGSGNGAPAAVSKTYDRMPPDAKNTDADADADADGDISVRKVSRDTFSPERRQPAAPGSRSAAEKIRFDYDGDARIHGVTPKQLAVWRENFPALDVEEELRKATVWLDANRKRRKHDVKRFLAGWLTQAQDRARSVPVSPRAELAEERRSWDAAERG